MFPDRVYLVLALLALHMQSSVLAAKPKNAILLSQVQSLTLRGDKSTSHRRVPAIPQLKCISPKSICALHKIDTMRCVNQGSGYSSEDIQWACTANLPSTLKLGSTDVICEGYASPDDPYVLKGSCGVEYRLALTEEGERKHPNVGGSAGDVDWSGYLFGIIFFAVAAWIIYSIVMQADAQQPGQQRRRPRGGGGGWGGGWGPGGGGGGGGGGGRFDDPPPPYPGSKPSTEQGWQPGFWTGLAGGAAAGYMAGRSGQQDNGRQRGGAWGGNSYGSGWGSGQGSSSSSSGSSHRHESTGFGSTSRR